MPVARATVETVAPDSPEFIDFLHNSLAGIRVTTPRPSRFEVQLNFKYNVIQPMTEEHLSEEGILASCPPELIVSTYISKSEEQWMGIEPERTTTYRDRNKHFGVHNSDDSSVFKSQEVFEQRKRAVSSLSQASSSFQQPSPTK